VPPPAGTAPTQTPSAFRNVANVPVGATDVTPPTSAICTSASGAGRRNDQSGVAAVAKTSKKFRSPCRSGRLAVVTFTTASTETGGKEERENGDPMSSTTTVETFLTRFTSGDTSGAAELLEDSFAFHGPMVQTDDKASFVEATAPLVPMLQGYEMHRLWADGDEVCAIYDLHIATPAGSGSVTVAEWSVVSGDKIASQRIVFDTAAFAALMPQG
jgi:predicted SnoaL-like aldol condensation-catalyzing enzyme